jgi:hypothetical protein
MEKKIKRRSFLRQSAIGGSLLGVTLPAMAEVSSSGGPEDRSAAGSSAVSGETVIGLRVEPIPQVRIGMIGLGSRGIGQMQLAAALALQKCVITALCDVQPERIELALRELGKKQRSVPATYSGSPDAWKQLIARDDIDLVIICTPWADHARMSIESMKKGVHVAVEVPMATELADCWELVRTAEETRRNCMMLENVCYGDEELWLLRMVEEGVFGTLTYAEAAYIHYLRESLFERYYQHWRIKHNIRYDGNLYPTHGLGPVAQYMGINRGDSFLRLVSMSSLEASLTESSRDLSPGHPFFDLKEVRHGDMNYSLIKTALGRTILVKHDVVTPRPYSRINALAGTKAYHEGYPSRLCVHEKGHEWLSEEDYRIYYDRYRHPVWDKLKKEIELYGGHGGMDFVQMYRLIHCFNQGWPLDMDVYDGAAWSAITPLSAMSIELGNVPVQFPDFTRGRWKEFRPLGIQVNL